MIGAHLRTKAWDTNMGVHREKTMRGHSKKGAMYKIRRKASEETNAAGTLILGLLVSRTVRK